MKTLKNHAPRPAGTPLVADDILEFHAGRILLLLATCGGSTGTINGLTKMAKLDFLVRYPDFFEVMRRGGGSPHIRGDGIVEAAMVRHHYGPWDKRYYHVLAFLESRGLITVKRSGKSFRLALTRRGKALANRFAEMTAFETVRRQMGAVAERFGRSTGNELKAMIYAIFDEEIGQQPIGHVIGERAR